MVSSITWGESGAALVCVHIFKTSRLPTDKYLSFNSNSGNEDLFGHGTHVAGTIAGKKYGVAKGMKIAQTNVSKFPFA